MKRNKKELQEMEIRKKEAVQEPSTRQRRKSSLQRFLHIMFFTIGIGVLVYVATVGLFLYRKQHPQAVDFGKLRASRGSVIVGGIGQTRGLEEELEELLSRNEETREFVENYKNREVYLGKDIDLSGDVQEEEVPLLMQWDLRWGYESYGGSNIGLAGCGPACLSMAYIYFTEDLAGNPREIARYCEENGFYTSEGTSWELWTLGAEAFGLEGKELPLDESRMKAALDAGSLIVCSMRPGDFTTTGHYILIVDYEEEGFQVHDPNRRGNSEKLWDYDVLDGQIRNLWSIGK